MSAGFVSDAWRDRFGDGGVVVRVTVGGLRRAAGRVVSLRVMVVQVWQVLLMPEGVMVSFRIGPGRIVIGTDFAWDWGRAVGRRNRDGTC